MQTHSISDGATVPAGAPIGFSYVRFSSPEQSKGDSLRRQTEAAADWCQRNGVRLDKSTTLLDLGKSAFRGRHHKDDRAALGAFIKMAESGRVPQGSFLIIERLDRLTREQVDDALELFLRLKKLVRIVQLKPVEVVHDRDSSPMQLMMALVELMRGRDESQAKSERMSAAWAQKKAAARSGERQPKFPQGRTAGTKLLTRALPYWLEARGGLPAVIPARAAVVKRVFDLAAAGYGAPRIVRTLTREGVPTFGRVPTWTKSYVASILDDRRALGECQPRGLGGKPDGDPIPNYFPAVVGEETWLAVREGRRQRFKMRGRSGKHVNLFAGLLKNALGGDTYYAVTRPGGRRVLINRDGADGRAASRAFPLETFEAAVLGLLREIDPHEILNGDAGPDETLVLAGELARVEAKIAELEAELVTAEVAAYTRVLVKLEADKKALVGRLAAAREKAAHPLSESWGEARSLLKTLEGAPDPEDARVRLRNALRRMVDSVWLAVIPRGGYRLAAVQVWFAGGKKHRDYLIVHRVATGGRVAARSACWRAASLFEALPAPALDLHKPAHATRLKAALAATDVEALWAELSD